MYGLDLIQLLLKAQP